MHRHEIFLFHFREALLPGINAYCRASQKRHGSSQEWTRHFTLVKPAPHFRANQVKQVLQRDYTLRATICNNNNNLKLN